MPAGRWRQPTPSVLSSKGTQRVDKSSVTRKWKGTRGLTLLDMPHRSYPSLENGLPENPFELFPLGPVRLAAASNEPGKGSRNMPGRSCIVSLLGEEGGGSRNFSSRSLPSRRYSPSLENQWLTAMGGDRKLMAVEHGWVI